MSSEFRSDSIPSVEDRDYALAQMSESTLVKMRAKGVIASWLREHSGIDDDECLAAAMHLIKTMTGADLQTFIGDDLYAFIRESNRKARERGIEQARRMVQSANDRVDGMITKRVQLTRDEFSDIAHGTFVPGTTPIHGSPSFDNGRQEPQHGDGRQMQTEPTGFQHATWCSADESLSHLGRTCASFMSGKIVIDADVEPT